MLVERCKKSEILVAFLNSAIFRELPVYVGQAVPFFNCERYYLLCGDCSVNYYGLSEMQKENKGVKAIGRSSILKKFEKVFKGAKSLHL